jgi:uncharacterized membrane protein YedE/YeeE
MMTPMTLHVLPEYAPWYVTGPIIGLLLVVMYALANEHVGISGAYLRTAQVLGRLGTGRPTPDAWKARYFAGLVAGALLATLLRGDPPPGLTYGALGLVVPLATLPPLLFVAGVLMGYGARWSGGCTSGHAISGAAARSRAAWAATATFIGTAVAVTLALHWLTGSAL